VLPTPTELQHKALQIDIANTEFIRIAVTRQHRGRVGDEGLDDAIPNPFDDAPIQPQLGSHFRLQDARKMHDPA
jgi:hypothetical protein